LTRDAIRDCTEYDDMITLSFETRYNIEIVTRINNREFSVVGWRCANFKLSKVKEKMLMIPLLETQPGLSNNVFILGRCWE